MTFHLRGNGGNYVGAEWIAAEGKIADDTDVDLQAFISGYGHSSNPGGWSLRLNSPGGSLAGGLRLGETIRKLRLDTEIGATARDEYGHWKRISGRGASACAYAFLGGLSRDVSDGELGVHQFYNAISLKNPTEKIFNSLDLSQHQVQSALLIDYVFRMGIDPRFVSIASATPPDEMTYLSENLLNELKVRWSPKEFQPWTIQPKGTGVIAITKTNDGSRTATFSRAKDGIPKLCILAESFDPQWINDALKVVQSVTAFDKEFPKNILTAKSVDGMTVLEFMLQGIDGTAMTMSRFCGVGVDGPRYMWGAFTYSLPRENAEAAIRVALKNCI